MKPDYKLAAELYFGRIMNIINESIERNHMGIDKNIQDFEKEKTSWTIKTIDHVTKEPLVLTKDVRVMYRLVKTTKLNNIITYEYEKTKNNGTIQGKLNF